MKKILVIFFSLIFIASCGTKHKKEAHSSITSPKYISVVENTDGVSSAYTEDGHTLIYKTDSNSNVVVYYAKFDDNAGKGDMTGLETKPLELK